MTPPKKPVEHEEKAARDARTGRVIPTRTDDSARLGLAMDKAGWPVPVVNALIGVLDDAPPALQRVVRDALLDVIRRWEEARGR